jgi:hypothetical protein
MGIAVMVGPVMVGPVMWEACHSGSSHGGSSHKKQVMRSTKSIGIVL